MKTILFDIPGLADNKIFNPEARDGVTEPFIYLRDQLRQRGYDLTTADNIPLDNCEMIWFWEVPHHFNKNASLSRQLKNFIKKLIGQPVHSKRDIYKEAIDGGFPGEMVAFLFEPPTTLSANWDTKNHESFTTIFTWHDDYVDGKKYHKLLYPTPQHFPQVEDVDFDKRKLLVNITGNKNSSHPRELYSERRKTIRYFEKHHPDQFDLFGVNWNKEGDDYYPSYRGTVNHKWDVMPQYRFALSYENMYDERGYVTEKILDPMRVGCVPVYWGAPNIDQYVDPNAFIDRRNFKSNEELAQFLLEISEDKYMNYRQSGENYLRGEQFHKFLSPAFAETIIKTLNL